MSGSMGARALLAVALFVGFYLLALGLAGAFALMPLMEVLLTDRIHPKLVLICWIGAGIIVWSILPRWDRFEAPGPRLTREAHPALFDQIDAVAKATGQAPPVDVYLVPDVNAFVAERGGFLGIGRRRVMGLGLPLLQVLTVPELRAVLAHEFGHYHGGDTALGPWVYKTRAAMGRTVVNLQSSGNVILQLMSLPFQAYGAMFLRVTLAVSRAQERAADALAAKVEGAAPMKSSLRRIHQAAVAFRTYLDTELGPVLSAGYRPPVAAGFASFLGTEDVARVVQARLDEELKTGASDPMDTHPSLRERLELLEAYDDGPPVTDQRPATALLGDLPAAEAELLRALKIAEGRTIGWDEVGEAVALPQLRVLAARVRDVSGPIGELAVTAEALTAVGLGAGAPRERALAAGVQHLVAVVLVKLAAEGFSIQSTPGEPYTAVRGDVRFAPAPVLVRIAKGEAEPSAWAEAVTAAGVAQLAA
jgi:heat shock protein HtpX